MANVFARSGEKAISLFHKYLLKTQLTLAVFYFIVTAIMLGISGEITHLVFAERITRHWQEPLAGEEMRRTAPNAKTVRKELQETMLIVNGILLTLAGIMGYFLAGITLDPLKKNYEKEQQFLSDASHELRTPLTILRTSLENLQTKIDPSLKKEVDENIEEVDRMHQLIHNLLTLSRAENQALPLKKTELLPLITSVIERMRVLAEKKEQHIALDKKIENIAILGNASALEQALTNIIENAIIYNNPKGTITISLAQYEHQARIVVEDNGIGMHEEDVARSTERFYRAEKSRNRTQGGSGIGLAIVKEIVTFHRGDLSIKSKPGKGTKITLSFPIHKAS